MKKIIFLSLFLFVAFTTANAQSKDKPKSIISTGAAMKKFHEKAELDVMNKRQLLDLYIERIKVLVNILPYIALTTKPGVTMDDVGVPNTPENKKIQELQEENTKNFLAATVQFQNTMMPFSDKGNIVAAILYYEGMVKGLELMNEQ
jgi:hypothetical protein